MASKGRAVHRLCNGLLRLNITGHLATPVTPVLSSKDVTSVLSGVARLNLASWPSGGHLGYICPSEKLTTTPQLIILEELRNTAFYDLPQNPNLTSLIIDPEKCPEKSEIIEPAVSINHPKEAREIMKIRRRKMNRHLLKKFRKRMRFTLRKIKREKKKKKELAFQARLAGIREWGQNFSALSWVQEELDKARKGGFYINVLANIKKN